MSATPHRVSHGCITRSDWIGLQKNLGSSHPVTLNGDDLSVQDIIAVSLHGGRAVLTRDGHFIQGVEDSVDLLDRELKAGRVVYGVNTGFGGSADTRTQDFELLQSAAVQHLNVGILLPSDKGLSSASNQRETGLLRSHALSIPIVRAMMLIRCNSLMRGHSGVRLGVVDAIMTLLSKDMTPVVPLRGSISASGDLSTLSYIAGAIEGNPDVFVRVGSGGEAPSYLPADDALKLAGLSPVRLQAKEALGITNGTAASCAAAAIAVHQANQLAVLTQLLTAMGTEALAGTAHNYHPFISAARPHRGQAEAAANILSFLRGSKISPDKGPSSVGLAQDRYALRTAPQWIGPQLEDLVLATEQVETEINSTTDNPLIDVDGNQIHHGGNFQAAAITSAMEKTTIALQNLGRLLFAQCSELINHQTNKGLPPNLSADDPSLSFTCKGFDVNMAAYMAEMSCLAHPVSAHMQVAEMANQSVNSMALVAARRALEAVELLSLMAATYVYVLCQALDLRCIQFEFRKEATRAIYNAIEEMFWQHDPSGDGTAVRWLADAAAPTLLGKWERLAHLDNIERGKVASQESIGAFLERVAPLGPPLGAVQLYKERVALALSRAYDQAREEFFGHQKTTEYVGDASRVIYEFVRKDLGIPMNRGVVDHPTLLAEAERRTNLNGTGGAHGTKARHTPSRSVEANGIGPSMKGKILGSAASEIYLSIRNGELHSRIMKYCEKSNLLTTV